SSVHRLEGRKFQLPANCSERFTRNNEEPCWMIAFLNRNPSGEYSMSPSTWSHVRLSYCASVAFTCPTKDASVNRPTTLPRQATFPATRCGPASGPRIAPMNSSHSARLSLLKLASSAESLAPSVPSMDTCAEGVEISLWDTVTACRSLR